MAHYNASVETPRPLDEVFGYVSDFSTTGSGIRASWRRSVWTARRSAREPSSG
jgi:hypothetical protein